MGLDVSAYRQIAPVPEVTDIDEAYAKGLVYLWVNADFPDRADSVMEGAYRYVERMDVSHTSYDGYNIWRAWLCQAVLGVVPETVWANYEAFKDLPFAPLIHFSDCEGLFGPQTSARLARDFEAHRERVVQHPPPADADFVAWYDRFAKGFAMAADGGCVKFS